MSRREIAAWIAVWTLVAIVTALLIWIAQLPVGGGIYSVRGTGMAPQRPTLAIRPCPLGDLVDPAC